MSRAAPVELARMGLDPAAFHYSDDRSWRGSCPRCGGHRRCLVFADHPFPKWRVQCDECGLKAWADQLNESLKQPVPDELRREWAERRRQEDERRERARRERVDAYTVAATWRQYHDCMTDAERALWRAAGIPDDWQDYWHLGYTPDKLYRRGEELCHSAALTIPYFHAGWQFQTMQFRLMSAADPADRYRFEYRLPATYYNTDPSAPIQDTAIICEGAKKAMVVRLCLGQKCPSVLAVPSKSAGCGVEAAVSQCGRVWVMLDPDAEAAAVRLGRAIGAAARVVRLPAKADDFLLDFGGTEASLRRHMAQGRRC